jgi:RNA polymerase sigma factor (sigma-70 family)
MVVRCVDHAASEKTKVTQSVSRSRFDDFYADEFAATTRLAHLLTGRDDVAEDLAQDAMARIHRHFDDLDNPAAYLRTTLVNLCRSWHRGAVRERDRNERIPPLATFLGPDVEEVLAVVDRLPYRQRAVIVMRYWLDLSEANIAEHLGCRPGTVKSLSARALANLHKELQ